MNTLITLLRRKFFNGDRWDHFSAIIHLAVPLVGALTIIAIISADTNHPLIEGIQAWLVSFWPISAFFVVLNFATFLVIAHGMGKAIELGRQT